MNRKMNYAWAGCFVLALVGAGCGDKITDPADGESEPGLFCTVGGRTLKWEAVAQAFDGEPGRASIVVMWHPGDDLFMEQVAVTIPHRTAGTWSVNSGVVDEGQQLQYIAPDAGSTIYLANPNLNGSAGQITVDRFEARGGWIEGTFHGTCVEFMKSMTPVTPVTIEGRFKVKNEIL